MVLVARDDPLDTYLVHHPTPCSAPRWRAACSTRTNPYVLGPQLACAAAELPLTEADVSEVFGGAAAAAVLAELVADGVLRRRPTRLVLAVVGAAAPPASVDMRGAGPGPGGRGGGRHGPDARHGGRALGRGRERHPGAVYLHRGESYVVEELDLDAGLALVHAAEPDWRTDARSTADVAVARVLEHRDHGAVRVSFGEVTVTTQVMAYQRRTPDGAVLETVPLDMPAQTSRRARSGTTSTTARCSAQGCRRVRIPGALHAAEHAAIGLLPAVRDLRPVGHRGDVDALHPHTGCPTVFVHDGHPGGAGFAERGHAVLAALADGHPRRHRRLRVPRRLPVVRAVAEVRQRQRAARQGGRGDRAGRGAGRAVGAGIEGTRRLRGT